MRFSFHPVIIYLLVILVYAFASNEITESIQLTSPHVAEQILENSRVLLTCVASKHTESIESEDSDDTPIWEDIEVIIRHNGSDTVRNY